jgi:hypothetical protein
MIVFLFVAMCASPYISGERFAIYADDERQIAEAQTIVDDRQIDNGRMEDDDRHSSNNPMSDLLSDSSNFDIDEWMDGFDPDADFGGLGFEQKTGPGIVSIGVVDEIGDSIDEIVITEDGFRTEKKTSGGNPYIIESIPYGECVYGVYLTHGFEIINASIAMYAATDGGAIEKIELDVADAYNLPPVNISDTSIKWEILFVLRHDMNIKASYFLVSPNDRFYHTLREETGTGESLKTNHFINTYEGAPLRVAIYIEMPALRNISGIRVIGKGFGSSMTDGGTYESGVFDGRWSFESEYGDYSLPDLTFTDKTCQLLSESDRVNLGNVRFVRFFVLSLPSAYEGASLKFERIVLTGYDGEEYEFANPDNSELTVRIIDAPKLL